MVKTREDILSEVKERFKDDTTDSTLSFIEDLSDTINDLDTKAQGQTDWQKKYEENDKEWREKYKARFFEGGTPDPVTKPEPETEPEERTPGYHDDGTPMTFDELFKRG